jgi:hypothetical protein
MMPRCWKCNTPYNAFKPMPNFHDTCDVCHNYWHSCCNCRHFTGYPTAICKVPNIEPVHDREGANFCDQFSMGETPPGKQQPPKGSDDARQKWNSLFKD